MQGDAEEQERLSQVEHAKAQEVERHVAGLYARAAEEFRERLLAGQQAAAEAAEKEEGHKRQEAGERQSEGKIESRVSPALSSREHRRRYICTQDTCASTPC